MQKYLDEFEHRHNNRNETHGEMFDELINGFSKKD
jgi:hypothetical protein